jgi:hypothetical protein
MYLLSRIWNPEIYQGKYKHGRYFEGWYFKLIDGECGNIFAVIPGVAMGKGGREAHSFVQVADAVSGISYYFRFPLSEFRYSDKHFEVQIADHSFSADGMKIHLTNESIELKGELAFNSIVKFPKSFTNPGIMGPFTFIPFMECYHGIINIHQEISGQLSVNNSTVDFTGGYGYIEKDWGTSFPEAWIWLQSNHFDRADASVMFSIAKIPWLGRHFTGFISYLRVGSKFYRFATYTGARVTRLNYENGQLEATAEDKSHILSISSVNTGGNNLKAPKKGMMTTEITESITSEVDVILSDKYGNIVFEGHGRNTGLEVSGSIGQNLILK